MDGCYEKILYEPNPRVPDNHIHPHFLRSLQTNVNVKRPEFVSLVAKAAGVACPCSTVFFFIGLYVLMLFEQIHPSYLIQVTLIFSTPFLIIWLRISDSPDLTRIFKSSTLFVAILFGLSPIIRTLTLEISSDSIWAISTILFTIHLFLTDFIPNPEVILRFPTTFSSNSAIFASTVLSSRLPSAHHVFSLSLVAVGLFALFPIFRRNLMAAISYPWISLWMNIFLMMFSIQLFWDVSKAAVYGMLVFQCIILVLAPMILLYAHDRYKSTVHGPWDEAKLKAHSEISMNSL